MKFGYAISFLVTSAVVVSANKDLFLRGGTPEEVHRALGSPSGETQCMQDRYTAAGERGTLGCTSNDVEVTTVTKTGGPDACHEGDIVTITADFTLVLNANARYDIGLYLLNDWSDESATALDGDSCILTGFEYDSDGTCGDLTNGSRDITGVELEVLCSNANGGSLSLPYCTSWHQQDVDTCNSLDDIGYPLTKSKCNCREASLPIRLCEVEVTPIVYESCDGGTIHFDSTATGIVGDDPTYEWEATDGSNVYTASGASGSFTDLPPGDYEVSVLATDGPCNDAAVAGGAGGAEGTGTFNVIDSVSIDASIEGTCDGEYNVAATTTGGRGVGTYIWHDEGESLAVAISWGTTSSAHTIQTDTTGTVTASVEYTEACDNCEETTCEYTLASSLEDTVYSPIGITLSGSVNDATCETPGSPTYTISTSVTGGSGSYSLSGSSFWSDALTCGGTSCTLDLSDLSGDCLSDTYAVTVTDNDNRCGSITSASFSADKETTYTVSI